jgi:hypothetical protein
MSNNHPSPSKNDGYTVYPFYKGCVFTLEGVESVALLRDTAKGMIAGGLRAGHTIAAQVVRYMQQLDHIATTVPQRTANYDQAMFWCLNVMALEKMNALPSNDENGTMVLSEFVKE